MEKFRDFVYRTMKSSVFRQTSCKRIVTVDDSLDVNETTLPVRGKLFYRFSVPSGPLEGLADRGIDFLLMVQDYYVSYLDTYIDPDDNVAHNSIYLQKESIEPKTPKPRLRQGRKVRHSAKFVIVYCKTGALVEYGNIEVDDKYAALRMDSWSDSMDKMVKKFFKRSPISIKNNSYGNEK